MKQAIIVGHTGQDGYFLSELLRKNHYDCIGINSKNCSENSYGITKADIVSATDTENLIRKVSPDEIYFLAAVHHSSSDIRTDDGILFQKSFQVNVLALVNFLEVIRKYSPKTKLFYAASSHVFGNPEKSPQDESTPLNPDCIYGITKTAGLQACRFYRNNHRVFAAAGIFYNHESPRRESKYVSKKIVEAAVAIKKDLTQELILGNLDAKIDWGYAPDYMKCVYSIMQLSKPDDFIISSGSVYTIKDFVSGVFACLGLDYVNFVRIDPLLITKKQKQNLHGNNSKVRKMTGWEPSVDFKNMIKILVDEELKKYA